MDPEKYFYPAVRIDFQSYLITEELFEALFHTAMIGQELDVGHVKGYGIAIPSGTYIIKGFEVYSSGPVNLIKLCGNVREGEDARSLSQELFNNVKRIVLESTTPKAKR